MEYQDAGNAGSMYTVHVSGSRQGRPSCDAVKPVKVDFFVQIELHQLARTAKQSIATVDLAPAIRTPTP
jgi:hypothetical protein